MVIFVKATKLQGQGWGGGVKNIGTNRKVLSQEKHMKYENLIVNHSRDMTNVKFNKT
jgi:hypothetical protein